MAATRWALQAKQPLINHERDAQKRQLQLQSVFGQGILPANPTADEEPVLPLAAPAPAALLKRIEDTK